jgi:hypothetical protein
MTYEALVNLAQQVTDERSFVRFLTVLREDCESSHHDCEAQYNNCIEDNHWQTRSTKNFLRSMEDWAGGDFVEGEHGGDPILRRVATMLCVGRHLLSEDRPR